MDAVATRLRRSTPTHAAYTVRVADRRVVALVTAHPGYARRWLHTTRWLHSRRLHSGRLIVGLGVQWTPPRRPLHGTPPPPATLQLCAGHRCLVFQLAQADALPEVLHRFLADPRVTFVGSGSCSDRRMLDVYYGLHVASARELRSMAGMGNASMEAMADRFLGYPGIGKPTHVAMSAWHVPFLSLGQVEYACVDAYLAFRLAVHLCSDHEPVRAPVLLHAPPPAPHTVELAPAPPPAQRAPAGAPPVYLYRAGPRVAASDSDAEDDEEEGLSMVHSSSYASEDDVFSSDEFELVGHGLVSSGDEIFFGEEVGSDDYDDDEEEYTGIGVVIQNCGMGGDEQVFVRNGVATLEELEDHDIVTGAGTAIDGYEIEMGGYQDHEDYEDEDLDYDHEDYEDEDLDYD